MAELVRQNCRSFSTVCLTLQSTSQEGEIYIEAGQVSHAVLGELLGERAFFRMLDWAEGEYRLEHGQKSPIQSIYRKWSELLLAGEERERIARVGESNAQPEARASTASAQVETHTFLERLLEIEGVERCFAVDEGGALLAQLPSGVSDMESAIVVFVAGAAQKSTQVFKTGGLVHGVVSIGEMELLFIPRATSYISLILEKNAYGKELVAGVMEQLKDAN